MQIVFYVLGGIAIIYLLLVWYMYRYQTRFMFYPTQTLERTPADLGIEYEDVYLTTSDSVSIHGWFIPANTADKTVLFFHGNAGNLGDRIEMMWVLHELNVNVFAPDYRGYGLSKGSPDENGIYRDAIACWEYLTDKRGIAAQDIIVIGRSLGGGVASELVRQIKPGGLILESTFTCMPRIAQDVYPMVPARWVVHQRFDTLSKVDQIECPVLIIHSVDDEYIAIDHGRELHEAFIETDKVDCDMIEIQGSHGDGFLLSGKTYTNALSEFITKVNQANAA